MAFALRFVVLWVRAFVAVTLCVMFAPCTVLSLFVDRKWIAMYVDTAVAASTNGHELYWISWISHYSKISPGLIRISAGDVTKNNNNKNQCSAFVFSFFCFSIRFSHLILNGAIYVFICFGLHARFEPFVVASINRWISFGAQIVLGSDCVAVASVTTTTKWWRWQLYLLRNRSKLYVLRCVCFGCLGSTLNSTVYGYNLWYYYE